MTQNSEYKSGEELLADWECKTKEEKLIRAVKALMENLERLHVNHNNQSLSENLHNPNVYCSCADAYRMGYAALTA